MKLRIAQRKDAAQMLKIYAPSITGNAVSFETDVPAIKEFGQRIAHCMQTYPWLVCEHKSRITGYAYASRYRDRAAYQWSCECSVYVHEDFRRKGIAAQLYAALLDILKMQGFVTVYAVITYPNPPSLKFHRKAGFKKFAVYKQAGYKLGGWHDVHWYAKQLRKPPVKPQKPVPFAKMKNSLQIKEILSRYSKTVSG